MLKFAARRIGGLLGVLLVASFVVYASIYASPGSPETAFLGNKQATPEALAAARAALGLDEPFLVRYASWLGGVLTGDLGDSLITRQPVVDKLIDPFLITLSLVSYAAVLIIVLGLGMGLLSALNPGWVDSAVTAVVSVATAVPAFVAAYCLIAMFSVQLGWFPSFGLEPGFTGRLQSLTLPAFSLAIISSGLVARVTRAAAVEQYQSPHVRTATSRGLRSARVVRSHVVRNAAGPIATVTGLQIAALFAAAVVVEQAFGIGGLGQVLIAAVQQKDMPVVQAVCLILVTAFVLLNLVAELVAAALDPRARPWRTE